MSAACSGESSSPIVEAVVEPNICDCNELMLDEGYNHFYFSERNKGYNGRCNEVYPNGNKSLEKNFVDGKIHGKMQMWYENGQLASEKEFDMNLQVGEQIDYSEMGEVIFHAIYKRGKQTEVLVYKLEE